ncbi:hypothetical protein [uncultured Croceitalea sp.]|uniref:hypothetical protein n=1 Tax=uncultured Croceitalea sp. TaxID=1798908 RepID=UPI003305E871
MGYAGQPMKVVKANRALLKKKRSFKEMRTSYIGYVNDANLKFKELTPFEQQKIRDKIIARAKQERFHDMKMSLVAFLILVLLIFGAYLLLF